MITMTSSFPKWRHLSVDFNKILSLLCHERNWTHLNSAVPNSLLRFFCFLVFFFKSLQEAVINYSLEEVSNWQVCQIFKAIYFGVYQQIFSYTAIWVPADIAWINLSKFFLPRDGWRWWCTGLRSPDLLFINSSLAN